MMYSLGGRVRRLAVAGAAATVASLALAGGALADAPTGAFVIGDQNAAMGQSVTFWGAQWWKDNTLSGGAAPAAFKGFVDTTPTCNANWTTRPGNSSHPPATIGPYVQAIVSSTITKDGPVISGDTMKVATIEVDPFSDYAGNPGHPGTGTVVSIDDCGGGTLPG